MAFDSIGIHPEINPELIPIDLDGDDLTEIAEVCHIIPPIAPEGNGCGRNSYRNAMVVSSDMKSDYFNFGMPSEALIQYFQFLAANYGADKISPPNPSPRPITYKLIRDRDPRQFKRADIEFLDDDQTRSVLEYLASRDKPKGRPTPAPPLPPRYSSTERTRILMVAA